LKDVAPNKQKGFVELQAAQAQQALRKVAEVAAVAALPIMYSRRIIDYNASC
jgi:hypothetical protein